MPDIFDQLDEAPVGDIFDQAVVAPTPDYPVASPGYPTEIARGLTQFVPALAKTTSTVGDKLGNLVRAGVGLDPLPETLVPPEERPLYKVGEWMQRKLDAAYPAVPESERNLGHDVAQGVGQMASMVAGGAAAKGAGASLRGAGWAATVLGSTQEFDDAFSRSRQRGDDPDTAFYKSLGYASISAMIENRLGAGRILRKYFPDPALAAQKLSALGVSKAIAGSLAVGFGEEGSQRFAQNWIVEGKPSLEGIVQEGAPGGIVQAIAELPATLLRAGGRVRRQPKIQTGVDDLGQPIVAPDAIPAPGTSQGTEYGGETEMVKALTGVLRGQDRNAVSAQAVVRSLVEQWGLTPEVASSVFSQARENVFGPAKEIPSPARPAVPAPPQAAPPVPAPAVSTPPAAVQATAPAVPVVLPKIAPVVFKSLDPMNPSVGWFELTEPFTAPETGRTTAAGGKLNSRQIEKYGMSIEGPAKTAFEEAKDRGAKPSSVNAQSRETGAAAGAPTQIGGTPAAVKPGTLNAPTMPEKIAPTEPDLFSEKPKAITPVKLEVPPVVPEKLTSPKQETRSTVEILNQEKRVKVTVPTGATMLRVTTPDGKVSVQPLSNVNKGDNVFRGSVGTKIEAGTIDRRGQFAPMRGDVKVARVDPPNPHKSPASEKNSERAAKLKADERFVETEQEALDAIAIRKKRSAESGDVPLASITPGTVTEGGKVAGYYHNGVIYYILDNIKSPEQFLAVQREEIAHHINSTAEAKKVLSELGRASEFELERREIRGSYPKVESETTDQYTERIANEMLAKSRVQDNGLFQRMMDWLIEKLSNLPKIGEWIRESDANRQAILRTISRRLEKNFTAAGKTGVPLAAMVNTQVQGAPVGVAREQENIEAIQKIIRADIFDGTQPITEVATEEARTLFNRLTDPAGKSAATGEILTATNAQMGPGLVLAELWRYAEKMVLNNGDDSVLRQIVPRYQDFNLGEGGPTGYGRGLRALQETDTLFRQLYEIEKEKRKAAGDKMSVGQELLNELIEALRQVSPDVAEIEADFDATAGIKIPKSLKSLIESIRTSPYASQSDPAWRRETAIQWFLSNGLSREQAEAASVKFEAAFDKAFAKALEREARSVLGKKTPPTKIEEIVRAIRAGVTDPATALVDYFAKEAGFNPATPEQNSRLVALDQRLSDPDLSLPERKLAVEEMNGIFRQMKLPPSVMTKLSANFVATLLTGIRTLTVNIFAPATHLLTERVLLSATNPRDLLTHWKALAGGWSNWLREAQFTATEDVMTYLNDDFRGATNVLKRMWEDGVRDMRSGSPKRQAKGLWQLVSGSQQYAMRMLNAADQANMRAESEAMLVLYGSDVLRQNGFGTKEVEMMVKAVPRIKNELIQQGLDQGMSPKLARVRADSMLAEKLREFVKNDIGELAGDEFGAAVNAAEMEGYNITGRLGIEMDTREPMKETDEGGMLSRLVLHHVLEWSSKMRSKPGSGPAVAVALLGYLNVPLRTARFYAWNSGYGLIRLGIHAFRKRQGWDNWWKQSLGSELQERHRLKMAVAATVAQAIIVGAGFALLKGSDDDDAGEDKLGVYVTGDGPKNKNLKDAWSRRGFQAQSIVMFVAGKPVRVPLTRLGEPLAHIFWPLSALDDWRWRKKEAEAAGRPFAEPPSETVMRSIGTYAGLLGQRGPLQSVTQWAKVGSGEGGTAKILAQQTSRVVSAAVTPWLGLQSSASAMMYGPIDQSSISAAIYASMPVLGMFGEKFRKQQLNRFGDPLYDQSWYSKIAQTGVPIAFRVANTPENQKVYSLLTEKGAAPPVLRRYILEERFGPLTNDQFERFAETSGRRLKEAVTNNEANLRAMTPEAAKKWLNKTTTNVDRQTELDMGLERTKPLTVTGGGGGYAPATRSAPAFTSPRSSFSSGRSSSPRLSRGASPSFASARGGSRRLSLRSYRSRGRTGRLRTRRLGLRSRSGGRTSRRRSLRLRRPRLTLA